MGLLDALLLRRQMRDGASGWERMFVWAVMKASLREGMVGAGAVMVLVVGDAGGELLMDDEGWWGLEMDVKLEILPHRDVWCKSTSTFFGHILLQVAISTFSIIYFICLTSRCICNPFFFS